MLGSCRDWKGSFGFITGDDGRSYFTHQTDLNMAGYRRLEPGQRVRFQISSGDRGLKAIMCEPIDNSSPDIEGESLAE
jgi:CspA family cold shock protein